MTENIDALIRILVRSGHPKQGYASIPVPVAVESNSEEVWQEFQHSQACYDQEYAITQRGAL